MRTAQDRRKFLQSMGSGVATAIGWSLLGPDLSWLLGKHMNASRGIASYSRARTRIRTGQERFLLILQASGGMDATLGLDPQEHGNGIDEKDVFLEYRSDEILHIEGLRLGPAAKALREHATDVSVVNGILMSPRDVGHVACENYINSGDMTGAHGHLAMESASKMGAAPFGVLTNVFNIPKGSTTVSTTQTFEFSSSNDLSQQIDDFMSSDEGSSALDDAKKRYQTAVEAKNKIAELLKSKQSGGASPSARDIAMAGFLSGACDQAVIDLTSDISASNSGTRFIRFDTHSNHANTHLESQRLFWDEVAKTISALKSTPYENGSLFDVTVVYVTTEFSRTPALNVSGGKDHNPLTNSALIAGAGIRGGQTIGKSRVIPRGASSSGIALHHGLPFDLATCESVLERGAAKDFLRPDYIVATVAQALGVTGMLGDIPITERSLSKLLK